MSMPDGPGPPVTVRLTVSVVPSSVAVISSEPPGVTGTRDTHRILLDLSGAGELSVPPNSTPRMSPCRPKTCGTPAPSPENPARAQVGSGPVWAGDVHPVARLATGDGGRAFGVVSAGVQPDTSSAAIRTSQPAHRTMFSRGRASS